MTLLSLSHQVSLHCLTVSAPVKVHYCVWARRQVVTEEESERGTPSCLNYHSAAAVGKLVWETRM